MCATLPSWLRCWRARAFMSDGQSEVPADGGFAHWDAYGTCPAPRETLTGNESALMNPLPAVVWTACSS